MVIKKNKVYPKEFCPRPPKTIKTRFKNMGKWCIQMVGTPIAYIWIPICCCVRNPVAKVLYDEPYSSKEITGYDKAGENLATGMIGCMSLLTVGCCCFGCCGEFEPKEV